jgi:2-amino-4-hydroxy-6-hydroxymethyldihydropteridine diphosphokinase
MRLFLCYKAAMDELNRACLSLGSNLGDRLENLKKALEKLKDLGIVEKASSVYETDPVGYLDQPQFLNMACLLATKLSPEELLKGLKMLEEEMGREASFRNAPRPIDVDIIFFNEIVFDSPDLTIPHPRMHERAFVLAPLAELVPEDIHPVLKRTVSDLVQTIDQSRIDKLSDLSDLSDII